MWEVEITDQFVEWWTDLTIEQQGAIAARIDPLGQNGPSLGRPAVERILSSRRHNMKELRESEGGALPVLFMFDPRRQVILLSAATRAVSGTAGTSGPFQPPMTSTTNTSKNCARRG